MEQFEHRPAAWVISAGLNHAVPADDAVKKKTHERRQIYTL